MIHRTEEEFVIELEKFLKECKCKTWREVIPNECKEWEKPYRIDLIFYNEKIGYVAVEAKNFYTLRKGGVIAKAISQVNKYKNLTYLNNIKINKWCISASSFADTDFYSNSTLDFNSKERILREINHFIQNFINTLYDISILEFKEHDNPKWNKVVIDYGLSNKKPIHISRENIEIHGVKNE